jgi:transposase InsO family protein
MGIEFKTYLRWSKSLDDRRINNRPNNVQKLNKKTIDEIIKAATSARFQDNTPPEIVAMLLDEGEYIASSATFYRVLGRANLLTHRKRGKSRSTLQSMPVVAIRSNQIWSWDITYLASNIKGKYFYLYLFVDIYSRKIVGGEVYERENQDYSAKIVNDIYIKEKISNGQITLHSDNGGPMRGQIMLMTLQKLGVAASFSRPRVSNDNPYSESLFKTLKYRPEYPDFFKTLAEARQWVTQFIYWYNEIHKHSAIKYVTPSQRHRGDDIAILAHREEVLLQAKKENPKNWNNRNLRNYEPIKEVILPICRIKENLNLVDL